MDLEGARAAKGNEKAISFHIKSELARLVEKRVMTPAEAELADVRMAARFLTGPLGQRMLAASWCAGSGASTCMWRSRFPRCFRV